MKTPDIGNHILVGSEDPECDPHMWIENPDEFNRSLVRIADDKIAPAAAGDEFLKNKPEVWKPWVTPEAAQKIEAAVGTASH